MKTGRALTAAVLALLMAWSMSSAEILKRNYDTTVALRSGGTVDLKNITGKVSVNGWDREEVRVRALVSLDSDKLDEDARKFFEGIEVVVDHDWNTVDIHTKFPDNDWNGRKPDFESPEVNLNFDIEDGEHSEFVEGILAWVGKIAGGVSGLVTQIVQESMPARVDYEIMVPRKCGLNVKTVTGELQVAGVEGDIRTSVVTGNTALVDSRGRLECSAVTGKIEIEGASGQIKVKVITGETVVGLAGDGEFNGLDCNSINGDILVKVPPELKAFKMDIKSINGGITMDTDNFHGTNLKGSHQGSINGGGPELDLKAINGSIRVERAVR